MIIVTNVCFRLLLSRKIWLSLSKTCPKSSLISPVSSRSFFKLPNPLKNKPIEISERKIVGYSAEQMYEVVSRVDRYEEFLPWCKKSLVTSRRSDRLTADLVVGFPPVVESYTSTVTLVRPHLVKAECTDGKIFNHMLTEWKFGSGVTNNAKSCTLDLHVSFEFRSVFHSTLASTFIDEVFNKMSNAFLKRAEECYGKESVSTRLLRRT